MADVRLVALALLPIINACGANLQRDPPATIDGAARPCVAVDSTAPPPTLTGQLVGGFRLTMVATSGARTGRAAIGSLTLDSHAGTASIALDSVGAIAAGDIGSRDPNRPGVLLVGAPNDSSGKQMLRFGADANRSDVRAFDSAYLILIVDAASAANFSGRWRSGVGTTVSAGYFCAERVSARTASDHPRPASPPHSTSRTTPASH